MAKVGRVYVLSKSIIVHVHRRNDKRFLITLLLRKIELIHLNQQRPTIQVYIEHTGDHNIEMGNQYSAVSFA